MRGVDFEVYRLSVDALVVSCYPCCLGFDLAPNLGEVVELPPWNVEKLSPFLLSRHTCWSMRNMYLVVVIRIVAFARKIDELEDERPPGHDAATSGEKVSADDILEYRRLSS
jgi:hypothetical protein